MTAVKRSVVIQVEEWLDGATIRTAAGENDNSAASDFTWNLYDQVLELFIVLVPLLPPKRASVQSKKQQRLLKDCLGKLFLWGDGFRDGRLQNILDKSDDLKEEIIDNLAAIGNILTSSLFPACKSISPPFRQSELLQKHGELQLVLEKAKLCRESDQESEESSVDTVQPGKDRLSEAVTSLKIYADCLMDLLPSMESTLDYADREFRKRQRSQPVVFEVSGPAQPYVLKVQDRFAKADARLVERLGEANWQRYVRLRNIHHRRDGGGGDNDDDDDDAAILDATPAENVLPELQATPKAVFVPVSMFHDSGLGSSLPAQSSYAATVASHSSFVSSLADKENGNLRVPSTPKEVSEGLPFTCQICGHVLSRIKNRVDWKRHVFADLKPYICTSQGCVDEMLTFPTRKLWESHEFGKHRVDHSWTCSNCPEKFRHPNEWRTHLNELHGIEFTNTKFQHAAKVAEEVVPHPIDFQECPLCLCILGKSRREFVTHVGKHMESIALASLPRDSDSDCDEKSLISFSSDDHPVINPPPFTSISQHELYTRMEKVLEELKSNTPYSEPFLRRVSKREAPDYYGIIKHPMDLGTITQKLNHRTYRSFLDFSADLDIIWSNCLKYNTDPTSHIRHMANSMRTMAESLLSSTANTASTEDVEAIFSREKLTDILPRLMHIGEDTTYEEIRECILKEYDIELNLQQCARAREGILKQKGQGDSRDKLPKLGVK